MQCVGGSLSAAIAGHLTPPQTRVDVINNKRKAKDKHVNLRTTLLH